MKTSSKMSMMVITNTHQQTRTNSIQNVYRLYQATQAEMPCRPRMETSMDTRVKTTKVPETQKHVNGATRREVDEALDLIRGVVAVSLKRSDKRYKALRHAWQGAECEATADQGEPRKTNAL
jgi:hypothetical protein